VSDAPPCTRPRYKESSEAVPRQPSKRAQGGSALRSARRRS
jgi:hypothetical protein